MSAERVAVDPESFPHTLERLTIRDAMGDVLRVMRLQSDEDGFVATVTSGGGITVALDLDDTLALLSFLADAAGVERYVTGGAS